MERIQKPAVVGNIFSKVKALAIRTDPPAEKAWFDWLHRIDNYVVIMTVLVHVVSPLELILRRTPEARRPASACEERVKATKSGGGVQKQQSQERCFARHGGGRDGFGGSPFDAFFGGGMGGMPGGHPGMRRQQREPPNTSEYYEVLGVKKSASGAEIKKVRRWSEEQKERLGQ